MHFYFCINSRHLRNILLLLLAIIKPNAVARKRPFVRLGNPGMVEGKKNGGGGHNQPPLVGIGQSDLPKIGGASGTSTSAIPAIMTCRVTDD